MNIDYYKTVAEIVYYICATVAALGTFTAALFALIVYQRNSRLERSRWASALYEKFYEGIDLKEVRNQLDCPVDVDEVNELVIKEDAKFTDYLNFFEFVAYLKESKQLRNSEVEVLFGYYLDCLKRHDRVQKYI